MDGQHRVGAVRMLHHQQQYFGRVLVEVFSLRSEAEVAELFTDINKAEPVRASHNETRTPPWLYVRLRRLY